MLWEIVCRAGCFAVYPSLLSELLVKIICLPDTSQFNVCGLTRWGIEPRPSLPQSAPETTTCSLMRPVAYIDGYNHVSQDVAGGFLPTAIN